MGGTVKDVQLKQELDTLVRSGAPAILHFWASWCEASKHMDQVLSHLSTDFPHTHFFRVEAEEQSEIYEAYSVSAVPFFAFSKIFEKNPTKIDNYGIWLRYQDCNFSCQALQERAQNNSTTRR